MPEKHQKGYGLENLTEGSLDEGECSIKILWRAEDGKGIKMELERAKSRNLWRISLISLRVLMVRNWNDIQKKRIVEYYQNVHSEFVIWTVVVLKNRKNIKNRGTWKNFEDLQCGAYRSLTLRECQRATRRARDLKIWQEVPMKKENVVLKFGSDWSKVRV